METLTFPFVVLIVLNWQNGPDTIACLQSLKNLVYPNYRVLVVDNGSQDDSVACIRNVFQNIEILETGENLGYAGGNNVGIKWALGVGAEMIGILNNDVVVEPNFLINLMKVFDNDESVGVVTSLIMNMDSSNNIWAAGIEVDWAKGKVKRHGENGLVQKWISRSPFVTDGVSGAMFIAKRKVWEQVGLFDEKFFLYYEEVDWSLRVAKLGYKMVVVPQAMVWHKVSATLGMASPLIDYYMLRNHLYLLSKHWSVLHGWVLSVYVVLRNILAVVAFTVKSDEGRRLANRNARLWALYDVLMGNLGKLNHDFG